MKFGMNTTPLWNTPFLYIVIIVNNTNMTIIKVWQLLTTLPPFCARLIELQELKRRFSKVSFV